MDLGGVGGNVLILTTVPSTIAVAVRTAWTKKIDSLAAAGKDTILKELERIAMASMSVPAMMESAVKPVLT